MTSAEGMIVSSYGEDGYGNETFEEYGDYEEYEQPEILSQSVVYGIVVALIVFSLAGTIFNSLSLLVIAHEKRIKTSTVLIASLAMTDLFTSAFILPAMVTLVIIFLSFFFFSFNFC